MNNLFWIFTLMLMIITISGSLNSAINVHENFLEEVLEINENTNEPIKGYDYYPLLATLKSDCDNSTEEEEEDVVPYRNTIDTDIIQEKKTIPEVIKRVPIEMNIPKPVVRQKISSEPQAVTGYSSGSPFLAPF